MSFIRTCLIYFKRAIRQCSWQTVEYRCILSDMCCLQIEIVVLCLRVVVGV